MTIAIVTGSHRPKGESGRIGRWLHKKITADGQEAWVMDLSAVELPYWDEGMWGQEDLKDKWEDLWQPWAEKLRAAEGVVVVCPEWNGMMPAKLKNFFHLCSHREIGHKAGLIVTVSSGVNGVYPVIELRSHAVKNSKLCWLPEHLVVRNVQEMFQEKKPASEHEATLRERVDFTLKVFYEYVKALTLVRESGVTETDKFAYGM
jgi:NAD(P)H-dependent FMN reductase